MARVGIGTAAIAYIALDALGVSLTAKLGAIAVAIATGAVAGLIALLVR